MAFLYSRRRVVKKRLPLMMCLMAWGTGLHASVKTASDEQRVCCKRGDRTESSRLAAEAFRNHYFSSPNGEATTTGMLKLHHRTFQELPFEARTAQELREKEEALRAYAIDLRRLQLRAEEAERGTAAAREQTQALEAQLAEARRRLVRHRNFAQRAGDVLPAVIALFGLGAAAHQWNRAGNLQRDNFNLNHDPAGPGDPGGQLQQRNADVVGLERQAQARNADIFGLRQDVHGRDADIRNLRHDVDNRDADIRNLQREVQAREAGIRNLLQDVQVRDVNIADLQQQAEARQRAIGNLVRLLDDMRLNRLDADQGDNPVALPGQNQNRGQRP